jgi:hypothetical protein
MDVHVDEARGDDRPARVDDPRIRGVDVLANLDDDAVLDEHVAQRIEALRRIDDAAAANEGSHATSAPFTSRSSTAMRTNTPLPTCAT